MAAGAHWTCYLRVLVTWQVAFLKRGHWQCFVYYLHYIFLSCSPEPIPCESHTFSAFWLWSSVVSVLISVTTNITPIWSLSCHFNFYWERAYLGPSPVSFYPWLCFAHLLEFREPFGVTWFINTVGGMVSMFVRVMPASNFILFYVIIILTF